MSVRFLFMTTALLAGAQDLHAGIDVLDVALEESENDRRRLKNMIQEDIDIYVRPSLMLLRNFDWKPVFDLLGTEIATEIDLYMKSILDLVDQVLNTVNDAVQRKSSLDLDPTFTKIDGLLALIANTTAENPEAQDVLSGVNIALPLVKMGLKILADALTLPATSKPGGGRVQVRVPNWVIISLTTLQEFPWSTTLENFVDVHIAQEIERYLKVTLDMIGKVLVAVQKGGSPDLQPFFQILKNLIVLIKNSTKDIPEAQTALSVIQALVIPLEAGLTTVIRMLAVPANEDIKVSSMCDLVEHAPLPEGDLKNILAKMQLDCKGSYADLKTLVNPVMRFLKTQEQNGKLKDYEIAIEWFKSILEEAAGENGLPEQRVEAGTLKGELVALQDSATATTAAPATPAAKAPAATTAAPATPAAKAPAATTAAPATPATAAPAATTAAPATPATAAPDSESIPTSGVKPEDSDSTEDPAANASISKDTDQKVFGLNPLDIGIIVLGAVLVVICVVGSYLHIKGRKTKKTQRKKAPRGSFGQAPKEWAAQDRVAIE